MLAEISKPFLIFFKAVDKVALSSLVVEETEAVPQEAKETIDKRDKTDKILDFFIFDIFLYIFKLDNRHQLHRLTTR